MIEGLERRQAPVAVKTATALSFLLLLAVISFGSMIVLLIRFNALIEDNKRNSEYLIECTTPGTNPPPRTGHKCYDDGQARTADAVKQIVDSNNNGIPDIKDLADALKVSLKGSK